MSVLAPPRYRSPFSAEVRGARAANSAMDLDRVEHYRSLYEESLITAVAAQAEVTSLQVQLDMAHIELATQDNAVKSLTEKNKILTSVVAAKEEKLLLFNQKLATIKAAVTKGLDKQRSGDKELRLTLDCILRCCRELCTHIINPEEFHLAVELIISTTLSPSPHLHHTLTTPTKSSREGAEFGEEARLQLASLPLEERRQQLEEIMNRGSIIDELVKDDERKTSAQSPTTCPLSPPTPQMTSPLPQSAGASSVQECGDSYTTYENGSSLILKVAEEEKGEGEKEGEGSVQNIYERMNSLVSYHGDKEWEKDSKKGRKMRYSSSANALVSKGTETTTGAGSVTPSREDYSGGQLHVWKKKLGLREGSVFTGSLPDLEVPGRAEEEQDEEDDGGEDEYIDPRELASAFISPRLGQRMSQRVMRRMDTMMGQDIPTYLRILPATTRRSDSERPSDVDEIDGVGREECVEQSLLPDAVGGGRGGEGKDRLDRSCYTTDDDLCSVDWDAEDEAENAVTSPAPSPAHPKSRVRRLKSNQSSAAVMLSDDDRIYESIDDYHFSTCPIGKEPEIPKPRQLPIRRRSKVTTIRCRQRYSRMKGFDGYEYLDTPVLSDSEVIPRWNELSPALPPPRKMSAPPFRTLGTTLELGAVHPTLSVPLDPAHGTYSPAISSDENNQSDNETTPDYLYTRPMFVTMESRPHLSITDKEKRRSSRRHKPLQPTKSHTLPASPSTGQHSSKRVDHCGYLTKLDSRLRPGKKRWFVLAGSEFRYYRNKESSLGRPRKVINLNSWCKLAVIDDVIFKLMTSHQTYHLLSGNATEAEAWVQALRTVLRRPSEFPPPHSHSPVSPPPPSSPSLAGWAVMSENGKSRKIWCELDTTGTLSLSLQSQTEPLQRVNMSVSSVRKVRDSLLMDNKDSSTTLSSQLAIVQEENEETPLLLVPCNAVEKDTWFYHLSLASRNGRDETLELTPTEHHLATIFREGGALDHPLWKHPVLNMTDCPLRSPLTSLPSHSLTSKAFKLFQSVQMFISTPLSQLALECHVTAVLHIINTCLKHTQLHDELYCQLLRQLSSDNIDQNNRSLQQGWCLLFLVIPMFLPHRPRVASYLTAILQRTLISSQPILTAFAQHCLDNIERVKVTGVRKWRQSVQEMEGLLTCFALNPTSLKLFLVLPIHLPDGTTEKVEFDASSTVDELLTQLNGKLNMPPSTETGFTLMSDWPGVEECAFFLLPTDSKLGDLLTCWWHAMEELGGGHVGDGGHWRPANRCIRLTYRNRLYVQSRRGHETEKEAELLAYQISDEVVSGRHRIKSDRDGIKMAAIMAQLEYGDWEKVASEEEGEEESREQMRTVVAKEALMRFGPMKFTQMTLEHDQSLYQRALIEHWTLCAGNSPTECAKNFLKLAQQWQLCGATLFLAEIGCPARSTWLVVHEDGISLLSPSSMKPHDVYTYKQLAAYGEDGDHLVLVVTSSSETSQNSFHGNTETEKLLLAMSKAKIHQATNLMSSYLEKITNK